MTTLDKVKSAYVLKDVKSFYDDWATQYEKDTSIEGHVGATQLGILCVKHLKKDDRILDLGCGTGLLGQQLKEAGFTNVDGLDASPKSLEVAKQLNRYKNYIEAFLHTDKKCPQIKDATYDALTCVGCFCQGHFTPEHFDNIFKMVKPGGLVLLAVNGIFMKPIMEGERYFPFDMIAELKKREKKGQVEMLHVKEGPYLKLTSGYYIILKIIAHASD